MVKNHFLLLTVLFSFLISCEGGKELTRNEKSVKEIDSLLRGYYIAMSDRDWPRYQLYFSQNATLTTIWQEESTSSPVIHTTTISEFIARTGEGPDSQPIFEEKMLGADITVKKDLAQAWVEYSVKFGSEKQLLQWKGVDLFSFIRHQGEWKIVSIVFESD